MSRGILLSKKHGVNPSLGVCFWCGEDDGTVVLPGKLRDDVEAPRRAVWSYEPCEKCKANMALGVTMIEATRGDDGRPEFSGRWFVVKVEAVERWPESELRTATLRHRKAYVEPEAFKMLLADGEGPSVGSSTRKVMK